MKNSKEDTPVPYLQTDGGKTKTNAISVPSLSLPQGGGAIKGIDEKFSVNAVNGTAAFSVALPFAAARGVTPSLSLSYNSGSGNGLFGLGWQLSTGTIKRKTDKELPQYLDAIESDTFLFAQNEDLVPAFSKLPDGSFAQDASGNYLPDERSSADGLYTITCYRPRIEGLYARIERWYKKDAGDIKWRVITRDNVTTLLGWSAEARLTDPDDPRKIYEWFPEFIYDDKGNCSHYLYRRENADGFDPALPNNRNRQQNGQLTYTQLYPDKLLYGNKTPYQPSDSTLPDETDYLFQTVFDYGTLLPGDSPETIRNWDFRQDAFSGYKAGFEIRTTRLCKRVLLYHVFEELAQLPDKSDKKTLIRSLNFTYDTASEADFTFLTAITAWGYIKKTDGSYSYQKLPPMAFTYRKHDWNKTVRTITAEALVHAPSGLSSPQYQFTDLYGEGLSGILTEQAQGWYYKQNLGDGRFTQAKQINPKPSVTGLGKQWHLIDLDADGGKQIVSYEAAGYFELNDNQEWQALRYFKTIPNIDFTDPNLRMLDMNGDGRPEVIISEEQVFTWYASGGREGFAAARKTAKPFEEAAGAAILFADEMETIFLADMSGDGLTDIVRIRNGEVCYWPNKGYGRFGTQVTMDNAPVFDYADSFNPDFIKLADIDGSGTTDIIYLGKNKFTCWKNLSGNRFSTQPFETDAFPGIHSRSHVTVTDLLGNGVACIVWSSLLPEDAAAPLQYIDLMNSRKPHLMEGYRNNAGKEVTMEYTPSTRFYLDDALAGRPWATRLPFPVHCVSGTTTLDTITGARYTTAFRYHHGYYDHPEREFRGFGMVEQTNSESFEHWIKQDATHITDALLQQEPVITRNWYHTGAFLPNDHLLQQFEKDFWYHAYEQEFGAISHPEATLPDATLTVPAGYPASLISQLTPDDWQEAMRACKGLALRSEVFAQDAVRNGNTATARKQELTPYTVTANSCRMELLQPRGQNKYAVLAARESQHITYHYERNYEDPRIAHHLTLIADEYGNVLEAADVVYARKQADLSLPSDIQTAQQKPYITYTQSRFTNDVLTAGMYRLRLPSETLTYELKNVLKGAAYYIPADFTDILTSGKSDTALYHQTDLPPTPGKAQKRLIEHVRSTYYANDLTSALPLHQLASLAVPFENYQLAYTPELITDIFATRTSDSLFTEGRFTHSEGDNNWWVRSGTAQYLKPAESITDARKRFYSAVSYTDPFGAVTGVTQDTQYCLFIAAIRDAFGNTASVADFNYRILSPQRLKDINGNLSEALYDEMGRVKAMAVMGKGTEADELAGLTEITDAAETALISSFFHAPDATQLTGAGKTLLHHATIRYVYDADAYLISGKPAVAATIKREQHYHKLADSPLQIAFEYSSGLGRVVMKKIQAEPGEAARVTVHADNTVSIDSIDTSTLTPPQLRWIGNGKTILNNKGNPVKEYEPYFSLTWQYEDVKELVEAGVTPLLYYDAADRLVTTRQPDGTFSKGLFLAWQHKVYDANDTVLESSWYYNRINRLIDAQLTAAGKDPVKEKEAAAKCALHNNTPHTLHFDTLGRVLLSIDHNKNIVTAADELCYTRIQTDVEGNLRSVTDARGNLVVSYKYDMLGNRVYQNSIDAGQRWLLINIAGKPLRTWDERNHTFQYFYDALQRPTYSKVLGGDGTVPLDHICDRLVYGESLLAADRSNETLLQNRNILGRAIQHYDTGGLLSTPDYDWKGQPLSSTRQLAKGYKETVNWTDARLATDLEAATFTFATETDALGRVTRQVSPDGSVTVPSYNEAGLLTGEDVQYAGATSFVTCIQHIHYNEKGRRENILYGNDVTTRYYYDKETLRLNRLESRRKSGDPLQDWYYTFDAAGNVTHLEDKNIPLVFFNNQKVTGVSTYTYDALYRLVEANGRENNSLPHLDASDNWNDQDYLTALNPGDPVSVRNYTQQYQYDAVGNMQQMRHTAAGNNWTRNYTYAGTGNRLMTTQVGTQVYVYPHHTQHGYMTALPHLEQLEWNYKEELQSSIRQKRTDGGTPETTYYQYDSTGQRIRKITENQAAAGATPTLKEERIYLGGYELYKKHSDTYAGLERVSLSLMDQQHRYVMIETRNAVDDGTEQQLTRYQLHNHLGSAALELDETARVISYEEYHPFGTTAYQAANKAIKASAKRYRHTGMERDEETGLQYHHSRYYLPWLGRWLSSDPTGISDGPNLYAYVHNDPISNTDVDGSQSKNWKDDLTSMQRFALWVDDKVQANPYARGVWNNLDKRGEALMNAPAAISDLYQREGGVGVATQMVKGVGHLVVDTGQAAFDVGYYGAEAAVTGSAEAKEKFASRATDVLLNTADLVTLVDGVGAAKNAAVSGGKALVQGGKAFKAVAEGAADALQGGRLAPAMGVVPSGGGALAAIGPIDLATPLGQGLKGSTLMMSQGKMLGSSKKPPPVDVAEVKPKGAVQKGFKQMKQPQYTSELVIGPAGKGGGRVGVATYSRETGEIIYQVRELTGPAQYGKTVWRQVIGKISKKDLAALTQASGGDAAEFGRLVEPKVREIISKASKQPSFNPGKGGAAHGPDFLPQQLELPYVR